MERREIRNFTTKAELEFLAKAFVWGAIEADLANPIVGSETVTIECKNDKDIFNAILNASNYHYFIDELVRQDKRRFEGLKAFADAKKAAA